MEKKCLQLFQGNRSTVSIGQHINVIQDANFAIFGRCQRSMAIQMRNFPMPRKT